ncbi:Hypothetical protein NTJ_08716 [Nesidiocoris tenuis]|uniref:Uncharacterized protein n=1 Tax=Nesidiocoris tenuis TaxID=355587 RepID=A0ABN7AUP9_9HEMI|nr:Hypothetical protein NTJ_08716 [Nesidiocoris tenuis]
MRSALGVVGLMALAFVVSGVPVGDRQEETELIGSPATSAQLESYSSAPVNNDVDQPPLNEENLLEERRDREKEYFESESQGEQNQNVEVAGPSSSSSYIADDSAPSSGLFLPPSSAQPLEFFAPDTQQPELPLEQPLPESEAAQSPFSPPNQLQIPQQQEVEQIQPQIQPAEGCPELSPDNECVLGAPEAAPIALEAAPTALATAPSGPIQQEAAETAESVPAPAPVEQLVVVCEGDDRPTDCFQVVQSAIDPAPAPVQEKLAEK